MYYILDSVNVKAISQKELSKELGLDPSTISRILNRKQYCSKMVAYCITKYLDCEKEILDFFENRV